MRGSLLALVVALVMVGVAGGGAGAAQFVEILPGVFPSAGGGAWGDYDGDGYPDLFLSGGDVGTPVPMAHGPLLYHNNHDVTFINSSSSLGLPFGAIEQGGAAWGDYDNDGLLDVIVGGAARPYLYRRDATGFVEVAASAGFPMGTNTTVGVAWCDYDGDSLLDAFCSSIFGAGYLMKNDGDGTFTEVSGSAGMTGTALNDSARSAAWGDYNNDGKPDIVLARFGKPTKLYRNNGDGTFTDVSDSSGVSVAADASSAIWGDYDNDGHLDLYVSGWLFHNNHDGTFTDVSSTAGLLSPTGGGGAAWVDYDSDGYLDLYITHWHTDPYLYHNNGNGTFTDVVVGSGLQASFDYQGGAAVWGDMDLDGKMDLLQCTFATTTSNNRSLLFRNTGPAGYWLRVRALTSGIGDATAAGVPARDSIGARVDLNLDNDASFPIGGNRTLIRLIDGGSGYQGQNEQIAHFGLGSSALVSVRVTFPDGSVVTHRNVAANQQIVIRDVPADRTEEPFDDIPLDFWAFEQVEGCVGAGIVAGYEDGTYRPTSSVDRATMAVYLARGLAGGDGSVPEGPGTASFVDVPNTGYGDAGTDPHWAYKYVEYAVDSSVVQGYAYDDPESPGEAIYRYEPTWTVTRDQMAVYMARAMVAPTGEAALADYVPADPRNFPDVPNTGYGDDGTDPFWAYTHIEYCVEHEVVSGYDDGYYRPEWVVTRDQMAVYVARAFDLLD